MSSGLIWSEGFYSPYTDLISIAVPQAVFYAHPNDAVDPDPDEQPDPSGWGSPFENEDGVKLPTGTKAGPDQIKLITKLGINWTMQAKPGTQVYGNIDWRGPVVNTAEDGEETRMRLTWNGPQLRYFPDELYDPTIDTSFEVYYRGNIIAVTPNPVLGAAAKREVDPDSEATVWMLYVMCKDGLGDILYKYRMDNYGWANDSMLDETRENLCSYYHKIDNPLGYIIEYTLERQSHHGTPGHEIDDEALEARTPWFFNESCTKLVCMREVETTYTDVNDFEHTEVGLSKYILDINATPDFSYGGNLARMQWKETHDFNKYLYFGSVEWLLYPYAREPYDYDTSILHPYVRFKLEQTLSGSGSQTVATDFDGDVMVTANMLVDQDRSQRQEFSQGIDCNADYGNAHGGCATNDENFNEIAGKQPYSSFNFLDGSGSPYLGGSDSIVMQFSNSSGAHEFTIVWDIYSELGSLDSLGIDHTWPTFGDEAPVVEFHGYVKRFMHFMDLRHPYTMVYSELRAEQALGAEEIPTTVTLNEAYSIGTNESTYMGDESVLVDYTMVGNLLGGEYWRMMGHKWKAGEPDIPLKPVIGGPDWGYSEDVTYTHLASDGVSYEFKTEYVDSGWHEGLDQRSDDSADIDPRYEDFWVPVTKVTANKWHSWSAYFGGAYYDSILGYEIYLNRVTGSMAKAESAFIFSYKGVDPRTGDPTDVVYNILNDKDAVTELEIVSDAEPEVPGVNVTIEALYPLGVI